MALVVPAGGFVFCSVLRILINAKRPYEINPGVNLLGKETSGKSFPSRHVFSIFIIAATILRYDWPYGVVLLALGMVLAVIRVKSGVHFIKDVVAGAVLGFAIGSLLFLFG